jgi:hypothetical protein
VTGFSSFEPWIDYIVECPANILDDAYKVVPPEWHGGAWNQLEGLLEALYARRTRVPDLVREARRASRDPFPNWRDRIAGAAAN